MGKKVRSARGELVDFDLLKIKEQIAAIPPSIDVQQRQNFVERRLRRRLKKKTLETVPEVDIDANFPSADEYDIEDTIEPTILDDAITETAVEEVKPTKSKQRARPKKQS